jgi:hypothetical protein
VEKPVYELNVVEVQSAVLNAELRLLTRGKLVVSIASKKKPAELILEGRVMTRATCEIFQVTCRMLTTLPPSCAAVMKSGNLNFLEPSGPLQACNRTSLPFTLTCAVSVVLYACHTWVFICYKLMLIAVCYAESQVRYRTRVLRPYP